MKHLLTIFLAIISITATNAQRYNFKEYSVPEGLLHSTVTAITEDSRGYLWLGTYDGGVSQFDGDNFVNYSEGEIFAGYSIQDIESDQQGTIWIASNAGLSNFDGRDFTNYTDTNGLLSSRVRALLFDSNGKFWVGTYKGINFIDKDSIYEFEHNDVFADPSIHSMIEARDKSIYIGTWDGIYIYRNNQLDSLKTFEDESIGVVYCLKQDSKDNIWFGTHEGIGKYDGKEVVKYTMFGNTGQNIIEAIEEDKNGNIWFATRGGGAFIYDGKDFQNITDHNGLSSNGLFSLFRDSNDIMWLGGGGLNKYYGDGFNHLGAKEGLVHDVVFPIIEDKKGNIWLGTEGGLSQYNPKTGKIINYTTDNGLTSNGVTSILETQSGDIWVTTQTGLNKLANGKFIQHPKYQDMELWTLSEDSNGDVWIGTSFGIVKEKNLIGTLYQSFDRFINSNQDREGSVLPEFIINSNSSEFYSKFNGFVDDAVYCTSFDDDGILWVGTMYSGAYKYANGNFTKYNTEDGLKSNNILTMKPDGKGGMWMATNMGLSHFSDGKIRTYTLEDGLWMNMIFNIIVDDESVWIGGSKGIQKLNFNEEGDIESEYKFGQHEGFTSIETNDGGGIKDSQGNLWFGTIGGATTVNPNRISYESSKTRTHITNIQLFFENIDWLDYTDSVTNWYRLPKSSVLLPYNKNQLTFEFAGLNLKVPEKIRYQWKLEGFDNNWSPITAKREANYTNLPPGNYTFMVKATNERGAWNSTPASISFKIDYPIYQRWWFVTLSILFIVSAIWGFISYRLNHIKKIAEVQKKSLETERRMIESERKALRAQINPHFIFNVLNSIQYYIQDNDPLIASRYLSKFAKLMRMILENSKSSSVPLSDELAALKLYMDLEILRTEYKFDYNINIDEKIDPSEICIPPMLIQPFIENSIRHGIGPSPDAGSINVDLQLDDNVITCTIEDNGIGINSSNKAEKSNNGHISSGMKITGDRLEILNAQRTNQMNVSITDLSDENKEKHGTRVRIFIPIE